MTKKLTSFVLVAVATISAISLLALLVSFIGVRAELGAGYELARLEGYSPYGDPETPEEIQANVKASYADEGIFLRMASGNVGKTETATIVCFMFLSLIGSVSGLFLFGKAEAEAAKKRARELANDEFKRRMKDALECEI